MRSPPRRAARPKPSAYRSRTAAVRTRPIPIASELTFFFSSRVASSSSSRTSALARSATLFAVSPRPGASRSVSWVCITSPVDDLREHDPGHEGCPRQSAAATGLSRRVSSWASGASRAGAPTGPAAARSDSGSVGALPLARALIRLGFSLRRKAASRAQLVGEPLADAVAAGTRLVGELLQAAGAALD